MGPDQPICDRLNEMFEVNYWFTWICSLLNLMTKLSLFNGLSKELDCFKLKSEDSQLSLDFESKSSEIQAINSSLQTNELKMINLHLEDS
jgi:hypothetical protein